MGAIIHSRAAWYEYGEKSNKYFVDLENHSKSKSCIRKVYTEDGSLPSNLKRIMKKLKVFTLNVIRKIV